MDACFAYDEELQKSGHMIGGEALQPVNAATTVRFRDGKPQITGRSVCRNQGIFRRNHDAGGQGYERSNSLMSRHPSVKMGGTFEIRPSADLSSLFEESKERRAAAALA